MNDDTRSLQRDAQGAAVKRGAVREIPVTDLMPDAREAVILYKGERYRLRITSNDKLILTK
jgi:hemin uptake protein HemP